MGIQEPSESLHCVCCWGKCSTDWWVGHQRSVCIKDLRISWQKIHSKKERDRQTCLIHLWNFHHYNERMIHSFNPQMFTEHLSWDSEFKMVSNTQICLLLQPSPMDMVDFEQRSRKSCFVDISMDGFGTFFKNEVKSRERKDTLPSPPTTLMHCHRSLGMWRLWQYQLEKLQFPAELSMALKGPHQRAAM